VWLKQKGEEWKMLRALSNDWKPQIISLFELYVDRLPGSFIEEKEYSVAFHYRESDLDLATVRVTELMDMLVHFTANLNVQVLQGAKVIEMRSAGVNKGSAALEFLSLKDFDFILAIGDDWTDEDMFRVLPQKAYSIKVGVAASHARFNLRNVHEVRELLE